jgi:predicted nucleic acid-binding protein
VRPRPPLFVDTVYIIAVFDPDDQWSPAAVSLDIEYETRPLVTTDGIISEFLAHWSRYDHEVRLRASAFAQQLKSNDRIDVAELTTDLVDASIDAYANEFRYTRLSLQDCVSILVMRERGITEALTADREFTLAGITVLMQPPVVGR